MTLISARDGEVWSIDEITPDLHVKISRDRTELEGLAEQKSGKHWGYCTPLAFRSLFGIDVSDVLELWL